MKTLKPRSLLMLDLTLLAVVTVHLTAALVVNVVLSPGNPPFGLWHRLLGFSGVTLGLLVGFHLLVHRAWLNAQLNRAAGHKPSRTA